MRKPFMSCNVTCSPPFQTHDSFYLEPSFLAAMVSIPPLSLVISVRKSLRSQLRCSFVGQFVLVPLDWFGRKCWGAVESNND